MTAKDSQTRHFSRRLTAAVQGLHLPSEEELLRGMNFFRNEIDESKPLRRQVMRKGGDPAKGETVIPHCATFTDRDFRLAVRGRPGNPDGASFSARCDNNNPCGRLFV